MDAEQGHKGAGTEGAHCVEVGVVGRPAGHDLLVVHQRVTGTAQGAAGKQDLRARRAPAPGSGAQALSTCPSLCLARGKVGGSLHVGVGPICAEGALLTSREGGCEDPGVSLRRSEDRCRPRLLTEDSERSHSLPREAELCHSRRGTLSWRRPPPPPGSVSRPLALPLAGYLGRSGSRPLPGAQEAVHRAAAGRRRQLRGQLRGRSARGRGAAGRSEQLL